MIKLLDIRHLGNFQIALRFSDGREGLFDGNNLLKRTGPLLEALREERYFRRAFIAAGAFCWPNGLELSPARLHDSCREWVTN